MKALKTKSNSSISVGFHYLSNGKIDGFETSAGNTGSAFYALGFSLSKMNKWCFKTMYFNYNSKRNGEVGILLDVGRCRL